MVNCLDRSGLASPLVAVSSVSLVFPLYSAAPSVA